MTDNKPEKVLMVCLGNICRSPMAEGVLTDKLLKNNLSHIKVDSAGTGAYHLGESPDIRAQNELRKHNIDISNLKARKFVVEDFDEYDIIFAMDESNYNNIVRMAATDKERAKVKLFTSLSEKIPISVPDPYYGGEKGFELVYDLLEKASDAFIKKYR